MMSKPDSPRTCGQYRSIAVFVSVMLVSVLFSLPGTAETAAAAPGSAAPASAAAADKSVITIISAQKSEYKKDPVNGGDAIVLTGGVKISVEHGTDKTTITADRVSYNRLTDMLYAEGTVTLEQSGSSASGGETITAKSLLFNTTTLEGIFDNGRIVQTQSDALNLPSGSTLIVASNIFGRDSSGTIAFKTGELTFCDDDDPHWKIRASRIWLLPGGEFAFLNAFLYVGRVPLLYFPAFYYPKDELLFNPAFGYRTREGYFINTTTYIFGRKPLDAATTGGSSDSDDDDDDDLNFFSFMKPSKLKDQEREGLVLHNLDSDYKGATTNYAKIMGDYYSNLGAMVGVDGVYKPGGVITDLEGSVMLGFSNTVFYSGGSYLPYAASGKVYSDSSDFMSLNVPFRYMANFKITIAKPLSLTLLMPVYSDPYFSYDFTNRAETMDWLDFLLSNPSSDDDDDATTVSSFTWSLSGSYTFKVPDLFNPFISSAAISSFSSSIVYTAKTNETISSVDSLSTYSPEREFYYPSQITPFKITGKLAGTLIDVSGSTSGTAAGSAAASKKTDSSGPSLQPPAGIDDGSSAAGSAAPPVAAGAAAPAAAAPGDTAAGGDVPAEVKKDVPLAEDGLPLISATPASVTPVTDITYKLSYTITPDYTSQLAYASTDLDEPDDFEWKNLQSTYYQIKIPTVLTSSVDYLNSFLGLDDTFSFNPVYQEHPYLSGTYYSTTSANSIKATDYAARKLDLTNTNALSFKPFSYTEHFANTGLTWNSTIKMIRTKYISDDVNNPEWEYLTTDLTDEDCVTVHTLDLDLAAEERSGDFAQTLTLTTTLPPQVDEYSGVVKLEFPFVTFSAGTGIKQVSSTDSSWEKEDFSQSLAVSLFSKQLSLTESYVYDLEDDYADSLKFALSGGGLQLAYTMSYTTGYDFDTDNGWVARSDKEFLPYTASIAYASGTKTFRRWKNRISTAPSLSTSVVYDCVRPTNSYFIFKPGITFKINDFLNLTFSSESKNSVIYRYMKNITGSDIDVTGETNPLTDLINSFRFDREDLRRSSGYKLKSLSVTISHDLHDWDLNSEFTIKPRLVTTTSSKYYDFSPYFTISVAWRPMQGMKTEIVDDYGDWELNP
jgi:hypothetical protein